MSFRSFDAGQQPVRWINIERFGAGSIVIEPGSSVEGTLNCAEEAFLDAIQVRVEHQQLRVQLPGGGWRQPPVQLLIRAPEGIDYSVTSGSADITARVPMGRSRIHTGSGDVTLDAATDVSVTSGSGDIIIRQINGHAGRLMTASGTIVVDHSFASLSAKSGSGDITVREFRHTAMRASSGSGNILVPATTGSLDLRTASGDITIGVAEGLPAWLDLHSVSGEVRIALEATEQPARGEPFVSLRARTASGEVAVYRA